MKSGLKSWAQKPVAKAIPFTDSDFYNATAWRNCRKAIIDTKPLCEVSRFENKYHAAKDIDHIIPIRYGGAKYHPDNLMPMTSFYHKRKTGMESRRNQPLVEWVETENGLIPKRREDIIRLLLKHLTYE